MRERELERILVTEVKKLGGRAYKWVSPGNAGMPDRIVILPDRRPIFVELKADGGKLTSLQTMQINQLKQLGQNVQVICGISGVVRFFSQLGHPDISYRLVERYGGGTNDL